MTGDLIFARALKRPFGRFQGELRQRRIQRAYEAKMRAQMQREANGEPVDPETAAQMTKPRELQDLFQVGVTEKATKKVVFLGPMMPRDAIGLIVEGINRQITTGQRDDWSHAAAYPMTRIQELAQ